MTENRNPYLIYSTGCTAAPTDCCKGAGGCVCAGVSALTSQNRKNCNFWLLIVAPRSTKLNDQSTVSNVASDCVCARTGSKAAQSRVWCSTLEPIPSLMSETAPDQTAPRAQSIAFLENLLGHASEHVRILTQAVDRCRDCDDAEAARVLTEVSSESIDLLACQQKAWQEHSSHTASAAKDDTAPGTNDAQQSVTDKRLRLAAMGGTPALGGMVLPMLSQEQLHGLSSTASAAAREVHAAKGHAIDSPDHSPPNVKTPDSSPPWLVELRAKKQGSRPPSRPASPPRQ